MADGALVQTSKNQQGLALLILVILIILAFAAYSLSGLSLNQVKADRIKETRIALKKAKQALIAYAVNFTEISPALPPASRGPGYFICPDTNNDGFGEGGCNGGGIGTIGRLPWRTLKVGDLRDSANERLWYAVSENFDNRITPFRPNPPYPANTPKVLNTETIGNITIRDQSNNIIYDGATIDAAVAVIIAPGEALTRDDGVVQNRSAANVNTAINYLDIDVASAEDNAAFLQGVLGGAVNDGFIQGEIKNAAGDVIVNDQIIVITYGEIMEQVHKRVSREISNVINNYFAICNDYPEAALFDATGVGPFNSVALSQQGVLPVGVALPVNWNTACAAGISLPAWIQGEDWHMNTYYQYSYTKADPLALPAPVLAANCVQGAAALPAVTCLTVNNTAPPINDKRALIIFAGRALAGAGQVRTAAAGMSDYFENENNDNNFVFDEAETEDYVWVIAP